MVHDRAMGQVLRLFLKPARGAPMREETVLRLLPGVGIEGNANTGGKRQVTVLAEEAWAEALAACGAPRIDPACRRANVVVRGLDLSESAGRLLRLGPCLLRIRGETTPCHQMEAVHPGLEAALRPGWRGGVFGEVVEGGLLHLADSASWADTR